MANSISNAQDFIDSRDIIARIEELAELHNTLEDPELTEFEESSEFDELRMLKELAEEASSTPDWIYGETLIAESYFKEYAEQLAGDIGAIDSNANWPLSHIDWDAAADALKQDYSSVDFDGVEYWIRA